MRWFGLFAPLKSITSDVGEPHEKMYIPIWSLNAILEFKMAARLRIFSN